MSDLIQQAVMNKGRKDKFVLILDTPKALKDFETNSARATQLLNRDKMNFSVIGVTVPPQSIQAVATPFRGQTPHYTSQTRDEYQPASVKFTIDNNWDNYWFIHKWLYILNNPRTSGMDTYFAEFKDLGDRNLDPTRNKGLELVKKSHLPPIKYKELKMVNDYMAYQTTITLIGLREYNEKIIKIEYFNAFPVSLGGFDYDYRDTDEIGCSFDFAYGQVDVSLIDPI